MTNLSQLYTQPETLQYYRNPTNSEMKFGHGSLHYREISFKKCFDIRGNQLLKVKLSDDGLTYYYSCLENRKGLKFALVQID